MLDKEQAKRMAEKILLEERRRSANHNWWTAKVPLMLRCDELRALDPLDQALVVQAVQAEVKHHQSLVYLITLLGITMGGALLLLAMGGPQLDGALAAYVLAVIVPFLAYARWVVRPKVRAAAAEFSKTRPPP